MKQNILTNLIMEEITNEFKDVHCFPLRKLVIRGYRDFKKILNFKFHIIVQCNDINTNAFQRQDRNLICCISFKVDNYPYLHV